MNTPTSNKRSRGSAGTSGGLSGSRTSGGFSNIANEYDLVTDFLTGIEIVGKYLPTQHDHSWAQLPQPIAKETSQLLVHVVWRQLMVAVTSLNQTSERSVSRGILDPLCELASVFGLGSGVGFTKPDPVEPDSAAAEPDAPAALPIVQPSPQLAENTNEEGHISPTAAFPSPGGSSVHTGQHGSVKQFNYGHELTIKVLDRTGRPDAMGWLFDNKTGRTYLHVTIEVKQDMSTDQAFRAALMQCAASMAAAYAKNACKNESTRPVRGVALDSRTVVILELEPAQGNPAHLARKFKVADKVPCSEIKGRLRVIFHINDTRLLWPTDPSANTPAALAAIMLTLVPQCVNWSDNTWRINAANGMKSSSLKLIEDVAAMAQLPSSLAEALTARVKKEGMTYGDVSNALMTPLFMGNTWKVATQPAAQAQPLSEAERQQLDELYGPINELVEQAFKGLGKKYVSSINTILREEGFPPDARLLLGVLDRLKELVKAAGLPVKEVPMDVFVQLLTERAAQEATAP